MEAYDIYATVFLVYGDQTTASLTLRQTPGVLDEHFRPPLVVVLSQIDLVLPKYYDDVVDTLSRMMFTLFLPNIVDIHRPQVIWPPFNCFLRIICPC
jgi:hypothetical protein